MFRFELRLAAFFLMLFIILSANAFAEKVKPLNPDCDVCPVVICYDGDEAKRILGKAGIQFLLKLKDIGQKTIKIDLDGLQKIGSENDSDQGYELTVYGYKHLIAINSIRGGGTIKIKTDYKNISAEGASNAWAPEIHLTPRTYNQIEKEDDLEIAWEKFKESRLYQYINNNSESHSLWNKKLSKMVLYILEAIAASN